MPVPDPIPGKSQSMKRRFWRMFRLLCLFSFAAAAIAVIVIGRGDSTLHINMLIATGLGVFFTMLLGTSLMTLVFVSADSGHDEAAGGPRDSKDKK